MGSSDTLRNRIREKILAINPETFAGTALEVFRYQAKYNSLYGEFLELLGVAPLTISAIEDIPFLPIQFFKQYDLKTGAWETERIFTSSGTTGSTTAKHHLRFPEEYRANARLGFTRFYGRPDHYCWLALLPAYLERSGSSLIFMADDFIRQSKYEQSGFFLTDTDQLIQVLQHCQKENIPTVLLGVSFALLDLIETRLIDLSGVVVMETGGMKGRRREITREELHGLLKKGFNVPAIHSEYGMTELFSQAYSKGKGLFWPAPTMKVLAREITDPRQIRLPGQTGGLNIIDLANLDTISFIATDDLGRVYADGSFKILGRLDASDIRGCNLLVQ